MFKIVKICVVFISTVFIVTLCFATGFKRINEFGKNKVGEKIRGYSATSEDGISYSPTTPPGRFFVHFINDSLPDNLCFDLECVRPEIRAVALHIIKKGGHFVSVNELKLAGMWGIKITYNPIRFNVSLLIVSDSKGIVTAMYRDIRLKHIKKIISDLGL